MRTVATLGLALLLVVLLSTSRISGKLLELLLLVEVTVLWLLCAAG